MLTNNITLYCMRKHEGVFRINCAKNQQFNLIINSSFPNSSGNIIVLHEPLCCDLHRLVERRKLEVWQVFAKFCVIRCLLKLSVGLVLIGVKLIVWNYFVAMEHTFSVSNLISPWKSRAFATECATSAILTSSSSPTAMVKSRVSHVL